MAFRSRRLLEEALARARAAREATQQLERERLAPAFTAAARVVHALCTTHDFVEAERILATEPSMSGLSLEYIMRHGFELPGPITGLPFHSLLHSTVASGDLQATAYLLSKGGNPNAIAYDDDECTVLNHLAWHPEYPNAPAMCQLLLDHGADPDAVADDDTTTARTVLLRSSTSGNAAAKRLLDIVVAHQAAAVCTGAETAVSASKAVAIGEGAHAQPGCVAIGIGARAGVMPTNVTTPAATRTVPVDAGPGLAYGEGAYAGPGCVAIGAGACAHGGGGCGGKTIRRT